MVPEVRPLQSRAVHGRSAAPARNSDAERDAPSSSDIAATIAEEVARRTELVMLAQRKEADASELAIDRMREHFDEREQERAELLREWNVMRDMAMEQMKRDNEIMKKWITLI
jgi:hypothetical protein